jgi:thiol-disulfide isomerase/thioredoxin
MEYIAMFISKNASFFDSFGNWVLLPLLILVIFSDRWVFKRKFSSQLTKWALKIPSFLITALLVTLIFMINFPLKPMVSSVAKVQHNIGQKIYNFDFVNLREDRTYQLSDFVGKVVLLNFWGTYCGPCIEEFPDLKRIEADFPDDVVVIALSDENKERIMKFVQKIESPSIVGSFASDKWIELNTIRPLTVVIDKQGILKEYMFGKKDYSSFKKVVAKNLLDHK